MASCSVQSWVGCSVQRRGVRLVAGEVGELGMELCRSGWLHGRWEGKPCTSAHIGTAGRNLARGNGLAWRLLQGRESKGGRKTMRWA